MTEMKRFRFWCQSVLPVVYDDSLSYYEVLCKVVEHINKLVDTDKEIFDDIDELNAELEEVNKKIDEIDTSFAEELISEAIATMVFFGLTDNGYFVAYIPDGWDDITFKTTGLDAYVTPPMDYGHLVLEY